MIEDAQYIACDNNECFNYATGRCSLRTINLRIIKSTGRFLPNRELTCLNYRIRVKQEEIRQYDLALVE